MAIVKTDVDYSPLRLSGRESTPDLIDRIQDRIRTTLATIMLPKSVSVTVDFGSTQVDFKRVTVPAAWVRTTSRFSCNPHGATDTHTAEDALLERLRFGTDNIVAGVSFDLLVHAPSNTTGKYTIQVTQV
jgi:hypothetical protein